MKTKITNNFTQQRTWMHQDLFQTLEVKSNDVIILKVLFDEMVHLKFRFKNWHFIIQLNYLKSWWGTYQRGIQKIKNGITILKVPWIINNGLGYPSIK